jgi:hypothetical protein
LVDTNVTNSARQFWACRRVGVAVVWSTLKGALPTEALSSGFCDA